MQCSRSCPVSRVARYEFPEKMARLGRGLCNFFESYGAKVRLPPSQRGVSPHIPPREKNV